MPHQSKDSWFWQHRALSSLIRDWDLIPGCPSNEFDGLSFKLLSALQQGKDALTVAQVLKTELEVTFGFFPDEFEINTLSAEVQNWWARQ
jgi:hypothetical protein